MSHRSWCSENGGLPSNERLEFLGDSVLGLVVTDETYRRFPDLSEGSLAKLRASVVNTYVLAEVGAELSLGDALLLGKGEERSGGRSKTSILADAFEAIIGAIYLDGGWEPARRFVLQSLSDRIETAALGPGGQDHKTQLQELAAHHFDGPPAYTVSGDGPDHERWFVAQVYLGDRPFGDGGGRTKKQAEQAAAASAWAALQELDANSTSMKSGNSDARTT